MLSEICFNLDQPKILSSDNGLIPSQSSLTEKVEEQGEIVFLPRGSRLLKTAYCTISVHSQSSYKVSKQWQQNCG